MSELAGSLVVPSIRLPEVYGLLDEMVRMVTELSVAGFIVYGGDIELTPPYLRLLRKAADRPLLLMADYERGAGSHVMGMPELPESPPPEKITPKSTAQSTGKQKVKKKPARSRMRSRRSLIARVASPLIRRAGSYP